MYGIGIRSSAAAGGLFAFLAVAVLAPSGCAPSALDIPTVRKPARSVQGIVNCGTSDVFLEKGITWTTHFRGRDRQHNYSLTRARVDVDNRSEQPHRLKIQRIVECSLNGVCHGKEWTPIDRTLAPGDRWSFEVDGNLPYVQGVNAPEYRIQTTDSEVVVVSVVAKVDDTGGCVDVGAWFARADPDSPGETRR